MPDTVTVLVSNFSLFISGASSDFDGATRIAKMMVTRFGMSDKVKFKFLWLITAGPFHSHRTQTFSLNGAFVGFLMFPTILHYCMVLFHSLLELTHYIFSYSIYNTVFT